MNRALEVLAKVPGFSSAELLTQLSDGPTNQSFEIRNEGRRYVLRIDSPEAARLGLDREREAVVMAELVDAGLAPAPVLNDTEAGVLLRPFIEGRAWTRADLDSRENLHGLARLLRRLHGLKPVGAPFDPLMAAVNYAKQIGTPVAREQFMAAARAFLDTGRVAPVLCHNDLVHSNIVCGESIQLIDWEYAAAGDPFLDLAIVMEHHGLEPDLAEHFFRAYLRREPLSHEKARLESQCRFYRSLLELWNMRVQPGES